MQKPTLLIQEKSQDLYPPQALVYLALAVTKNQTVENAALEDKSIKTKIINK